MSSTKRAKSSQRQPLSRERILQTALILADQQGLAALSMRKLAEALQVEAMSLYNHVTHKEDLLDGLVERVVAEIEVPTAGGDWREAMRRRAHSAHAALMRHPWATQLFVYIPPGSLTPSPTMSGMSSTVTFTASPCKPSISRWNQSIMPRPQANFFPCYQRINIPILKPWRNWS
jgi:AcrR family transcriptional regulator